MTLTERNGLRILTPSEGKLLTNGETYSEIVYLGKFADPSDWTEIDMPEEEQDFSDSEISSDLEAEGV